MPDTAVDDPPHSSISMDGVRKATHFFLTWLNETSGEMSEHLSVFSSPQMEFVVEQKFWRRGQWAASVSFLILILAPISLADAQQAVVRDLCSSVAHAPKGPPIEIPNLAANMQGGAKTEEGEPEGAKSEEDKQGAKPEGGEEIAKPEITTSERDQFTATVQEMAGVSGCIYPSPIVVVYDPKITAQIRRQYADSLVYAKGVRKKQIVSNVVLHVNVDVTTPPPIYYYRDGDRAPYAIYDTTKECAQAREGARGNCVRNDGPIFISLTGDVTNQNRFPLSSISIRCDYWDALGKPKSSVKRSRYTFGPGGGSIPYLNEVIDVLLPRSVVNGISCRVETAEIWQKTDNIQYLNASLNPILRPSKTDPGLSRLDIK